MRTKNDFVSSLKKRPSVGMKPLSERDENKGITCPFLNKNVASRNEATL